MTIPTPVPLPAHRWLKRLLLAVAAVLLFSILSSAAGVWMLRSEPAWYATPLSTELRQAAARSAEDKLLQTHNWAAAAQARATAARRQNVPAPDTDSMTIALSQAELNAFFDKWSQAGDWKASYEAYADTPRIALNPGRVILAAHVRDLGLLVSVHLRPRLEADGRLRLELVRVMGGRLPLPRLIWSRYQEEMAQLLERKLPELRRRARLDVNGVGNGAAVGAVLLELLADALRGQPSEPLLFMPLMDQGAAVPVRLSALLIDKGELSLQVDPLSVQQRQKLIERLSGK